MVVLTGHGRAFTAGTDVVEMAARASDPEGFRAGVHGFPGLIDQLVTFPKPLLIGRQQASWVLLSPEWFSAAECQAMGLAWRVTAPEDLMAEPLRAARHLATKPIASLVEIKRTIAAPHRDAIAATRAREDRAFVRLLGRPANQEAFVVLSERRSPDFPAVDAANPVNVAEHASD